MAIKFSQFTVRTSSSDLSHIVGYNGVDNIQITPTNFLNSALTGTAGQVLFYDTTGVAGDNDLYWDNTNKRLGVGNSNPTQKLHVTGTARISGTNNLDIFSDNTAATFNLASNARGFLFKNLNGDLVTINTSGDVGIGTTSPGEKLEVNGNIKVGDSQQFVAGAGNDLRIIHDGTDSFINSNGSGDLYIQQFNDDKDIIFKSDNGSGGITTYFQLDGSDGFSKAHKKIRFLDNAQASFGNVDDLQIYHDGTNSVINNITGNLQIYNNANDGDIQFISDNGSGGTTEYFRVDGGENRIVYSQNGRHLDNVVSMYGSGADLQIKHDGSNSYISNNTGALYIQQLADDSDIVFQSDDGSGGVAEYFRLDGSAAITVVSKEFRFADSVPLKFGNLPDVEIIHNGTNTLISNETGDLYITNAQDDGDILFRCDDGSGGVATYFSVDGGGTDINFFKDTHHIDNVKAKFGSKTTGDLRIYHNGTNNIVESVTGNLIIQNNLDDQDVIFKSDDGSGGVATYFFLDGSNSHTNFQLNARWVDNARAEFGNSGDLNIYHDGGNSIITNTTGELLIRDDSTIRLQKSNGENMLRAIADGAVELYHNNVKKLETTSSGVNVVSGTVAGSTHRLSVGKVGNNIGNQKSILELVENTSGSDMNYGFSFTTDGDGSNNLLLRRHQNSTTGAIVMTVNRADDNVTFAGNLKIQGISEYADNTAAIAAGLTTGQMYRTGDLLKIVH